MGKIAGAFKKKPSTLEIFASINQQQRDKQDREASEKAFQNKLARAKQRPNARLGVGGKPTVQDNETVSSTGGRKAELLGS